MPIYEIRVQGRLDQRWSTWFDGLTISALHGILIKVRDLALPLLAVSRVPESKKSD